MKHLNNPHLPSIIDVIDIDDTFVIVMDFVEGNSLEKVLEHGSVSEIQVIDLAKQLCDVLLYLHSCNPPIIYRDMKPQCSTETGRSGDAAGFRYGERI